ncbi:MAG: pseudouridine-5'-phosphate glycosidase [Synergistetes bacterium]|nr:pseudouridine-5'-phosphate glycosidase [Synergistota bacterium]MCX8127842.1 pseudouridine-5'-phosphate glycosidase [Synergistota bacterium]MDW8192104.1 pseudouridine-5'-phosphate glycosidase [Synergistota bacterium]
MLYYTTHCTIKARKGGETTIWELRDEIREALELGKPVVALESNLITHGFPYPQNIEIALLAEKVIREHDAVPATIAIIRGVIKVGITEDEIRILANKNSVNKVGLRDIPVTIARRENGALTSGATLWCARKVGIEVIATGGIGGVHRNIDQSLDISNDIKVLSEGSGIVVCSGPKAILNLEATLELLETLGVIVIGYKTNELPAFYFRHSGIRLEISADSAGEIVQIYEISKKLGINKSILVTNPPPKEAWDKTEFETLFKEAIEEAKVLNIRGKALTPYLLGKLAQLSKGKSIEVNASIILSNAALAAKIAKKLKEN